MQNCLNFIAFFYRNFIANFYRSLLNCYKTTLITPPFNFKALKEFYLSFVNIFRDGATQKLSLISIQAMRMMRI